MTEHHHTEPAPLQGESCEETVRKLRFAVFGFNGDGGLRTRVKALEDAREEDLRDRIQGRNAVILAALAAIIALISTLLQVVAG